MDISKIKIGDVFGEISYYKVTEISTTHLGLPSIVLINVKDNDEVTISSSYLKSYLVSGDQYDQEIKVGIQDKYWTEDQVEKELKKDPTFPHKSGDLKQEGIKSIWTEVANKPFTVCFKKMGKELSDKAYNAKVQTIIDDAISKIQFAKDGKKGVANVATKIIKDIIQNPVTNFEEGEERILRGYKVQHTSNDGFYRVIDLDIEDSNNQRLVNLNTIKYLIVDDIKYIVE